MQKTFIKISYRHIIEHAAQTSFEQHIHKASYEEFLMKSQAYNPEGKFKTFTELKANDGRANSLHYKSGFSATGLVGLLNNRIPFLEDNSGKPVAFDDYRFEVIESHITDQQKHIVALHFTTPALELKKSFANFLVLANDGVENNETFTLQLQPNISVVFYEEREC
jgi:hypothetical protein